jgi:hypothetical protein
MLADLRVEGIEITPAMRASLHAPVGLDLGALLDRIEAA